MSSVTSLPLPLLLRIFSSLTAKECATVSCVQKGWRELASEDWLWKVYCQEDWIESSSSPHKPSGEACSNFKAMYKVFYSEFGKYGSLYKRAKTCWLKVEKWSNQNIPEVANSLLPGATEAQLDFVEKNLGVKLPPSVRMLYRLHNGQRILEDASPSYGLLGGYSFYDYHVNTLLRPLLYFSRAKEQLKGTPDDLYNKIMVGSSFNFQKFFFLDCKDGLIYTGTRQWRHSEQIRCVPERRQEEFHLEASTSSSSDSELFRTDGMLRWLEEYSSRLESGMYAVRKLEEGRGISLYPELPPLCTLGVTQRVQIRASAVFVPEMCTLASQSDDKYFFAYSIRMKLLPCTENKDRHRNKSVQLRRRHWVIKDQGQVVADIEGEAVIGLYPLLLEDVSEEFVYQSCTGQLGISGSIEGEFSFAPGSLMKPRGEDFLVEVPWFPLHVPDFVF